MEYLFDKFTPAQLEKERNICVYDFCGNNSQNYHIERWADYWPKYKVITFGGDWYRIPDMVFEGDNLPTEEDIYNYANKKENLEEQEKMLKLEFE